MENTSDLQLEIQIPETPVKVDLDKDSIVRLQNSLLNGQYKFNLIQWRLFLGFLSCLYENNYELRYYNLSVKEIYDLSGKDHKDALKLLRKDTKGLLAHVIELANDKKKDEIEFINLFYKAKYLGKQGILQLAPHPELLEFYKELKNNFTDTYLKEALKLSTSNTIKVYLLLKQFEDTGWRKMPFDNFRFQLGLKPGQYKRPIDLERRFIKKAQEELKTTDMAFNYTKYGTPARGFHFQLLKKKEKLSYLPQSDDDHRAVDLLEQAGLTESQINQIMSSVSAKDVFKVNYEMGIARSDGKIHKTSAAWMITKFKTEYRVYNKGYRNPNKEKVTNSPQLEEVK